MFSKETLLFFTKIVDENYTWESMVYGLSVDAKLQVALDCEQIKIQLMKEVVGAEQYKLLSQ